MNQTIQTIRDVIHQRKTEKVIGDFHAPVVFSEEQLRSGDAMVRQAISDCGMAPFHYDRGHEGVAEPWRFYRLNCASCRTVAKLIEDDLIPDLRPGNKMASMMSACSTLILATWLPVEPGSMDDANKLERVNREHYAATVAAVQNLLLLLTAANIQHYWSSGVLIDKHLFDTFNIPAEQQLVAAVFASYPDGQGPVKVVPGKQRANRSESSKWFTEIQLD